ncbi:ubiquinol-cytochrome C reductase complex subunit oxen [Nomia melanderi]|uniref:ubiquinol-cytochrome C reductase complex subunit oxen n=1 Tax=Nomia melanderi TaxID=2448451 RepID=UPI0013041E73|nr:cytochrome b-c1 complex subunit 9 [Nomia melanderi]XP_031847147.1 cytochrome b-c1 complex subunit 9 [Nomia melanderi]
MSQMKVLYNTIFKRSSTFTVAILVGAFLFERTLEITTTKAFESINKGKLWKDIKHKYE